jgi:hypothetical protein
MKKVLILLAVVVLFAGSAMASVTASMSTGLPPVLSTTDDQIVRTFPQKSLDFANQVTAEFTSSMYWGYLVVDTGMGILGIYSTPVNDDDGDLNTNAFNDALDNMTSISYALPVEGMNVGLAVSFANFSEENKNLDPTETEDAMSPTYNNEIYLGVIAGASLDIGVPLDVALNVNMWNEKNDNITNYDSNPSTDNDIAQQVIEDNTQLLIGLNARAMVSELIASLAIDYTMSSSVSSDIQNPASGDATVDEDTTTADSKLEITALIGKEVKATDSLTVNAGIGLNVVMDGEYTDLYTDNVDDTNNDNNNYADLATDLWVNVPLYVAVEGKLTENWTIRGGMEVAILNLHNNTEIDEADWDDAEVTDEDVDNQTSTTQGVTGYAVGVTGVFGDLTLDLKVEPMLILDGPNFISGQTNNWSSQVALSYNF